jgi:hypothetical protein
MASVIFTSNQSDRTYALVLLSLEDPRTIA